jgi:alginate O-acetyltransferase complex protein AlgI
VNYFFGSLLRLTIGNLKRKILYFAIGMNLALLGYCKYFNFVLDIINMYIVVNDSSSYVWFLPLGISFFTFTQIAYLVDISRGQVEEYSFSKYLLFISYFPHLLAGPILHHQQMMPQFQLKKIFRFNASNFVKGLTIFSIGLAKKVVIADALAMYANPVFDAVNNGLSPGFIDSWTGVLAYTLQLYFDFSGYCDMAVGLSLMFNIKLPINFNSPYKASSIIEFWRNWNITLSGFLRDYLYIPLGGDRLGLLRRNINLILTMLLGGLWHGAGFNFLVWGLMHGFFLACNHSWREFSKKYLVLVKLNNLSITKFIYLSLTLFCVVIGWVFFRASSLSNAISILGGMFGFNGIILPSNLIFLNYLYLPEAISFGDPFEVSKLPLLQAWSMILGGFCIVLFFPNVAQWMHGQDIFCNESLNNVKKIPKQLLWSPNKKWTSIFSGLLLALSLFSLSRTSEFLYFQF